MRSSGSLSVGVPRLDGQLEELCDVFRTSLTAIRAKQKQNPRKRQTPAHFSWDSASQTRAQLAQLTTNNRLCSTRPPESALAAEQKLLFLARKRRARLIAQVVHADEELAHHHHHEGHHHADDVFTSWGVETAHKFTEEELTEILHKLAETKDYGDVLRAKGIVAAAEGEWFHFDLVPEETEIRRGAADFTGRICVIGADLKEDAIKELFHVA